MCVCVCVCVLAHPGHEANSGCVKTSTSANISTYKRVGVVWVGDWLHGCRRDTQCYKNAIICNNYSLVDFHNIEVILYTFVL